MSCSQVRKKLARSARHELARPADNMQRTRTPTRIGSRTGLVRTRIQPCRTYDTSPQQRRSRFSGSVLRLSFFPGVPILT